MKLGKGSLLSMVLLFGGFVLDALTEKKRNDEMREMVQEEVAKQLSNSEGTGEES